MTRNSGSCLSHVSVSLSLSLWHNSPALARASSFLVSRSHTMKLHTQQDSSGRGIGPSHRSLPDNTQYSNIHASDDIRTRNPSKRSAADPCRKPFGHWDRHRMPLGRFNSYLTSKDVFYCICTYTYNRRRLME